MTLSLIPTTELLGIGKKIFLKSNTMNLFLQHTAASIVFLRRDGSALAILLTINLQRRFTLSNLVRICNVVSLFKFFENPPLSAQQKQTFG
jgi:hypothetical protein